MPFLTGEWRDVLMLSFAAEPGTLEPLLPPGTELDLFEGKPLLSVVGFRFLDTRVKGLPVPFAREFEEVNLRFYVRGRTPDGDQPGVCFIKEIVPNRLVAYGARKLYNEPYAPLAMRHRILPGPSGRPMAAEYWWYLDERLNHVRASLSGLPEVPAPGSLEAFVSQRFWGFVRSRRGEGRCYAVRHGAWKVQPALEAVLDAEIDPVWGPQFGATLSAQPLGALFTSGSTIEVDPHQPIPAA